MVAPSKTLAPNGALVDLQTGRATAPFNNYLNNLTANANAGAAGTVTTGPGSGLFGGGNVAAGISIGIAPNGVTDSMIRQSAGFSVIGRAAGSAGNNADITATADDRVLARVGGVLAFWDFSVIPGAGSVTSVSVVTANGVSGSVANPTTTPAITLTLGAITPSSVAASGTVAGTNITAGGDTIGNSATTTKWANGRTVSITGDLAYTSPSLDGTGNVTAAGTLATVNANTGAWGSATQASVITLDGKGRATAAANVTITPAASSITGGAALTRVSDTNVTLTLGGSPTTALLTAASITVGWSGTLAVARGGTGVGALGDITRTNDTNVTLTLGGTPLGSVVTSTSFTLGWTGRLAYSRFIAATQKSLVGATAAGDFAEITLGTGVAITAGVLSATGTGGTVTSVSVVTANGFSGTVATATTTPAITLSYAGAALTKTDDTNVTLTLGGSPTVALLAAASLTLGWTGTLSVSRGGLGVGTVTGLLQGNGTSAVTAITDSSTTGQVLRVTGASTYAWGALSLSTAAAVTGTLPLGNLPTQTGTGNIVLSASPTLTGTVITAAITMSGQLIAGSTATDATDKILVRGTAKGLRLGTDAGQARVEGVDNTGSASYQPIFVNGAQVTFGVSNTVTGTISAAGLSITGAIVASTFLKSVAKTVATLSVAATAGAGARDFVTDSTLAAVGNFGVAVIGGGANKAPVYSDGAAWFIG